MFSVAYVKPITHLSLALLSQSFSYWAIVWGQCLTGSSYFVTLNLYDKAPSIFSPHASM